MLFLVISGVFVVLLSLVSIVPHVFFRTNAFDLGIFNQTLSHYAHFKFGPNTLREVPTLLADHLEFILFLFAPLYWIFGSYTLLLVQIAAIIFGGYGIYLLLKTETNDAFLTLGGVVIFYLFFGLYQALAFDYHNNVVGTMFIPWMFYFFSQKKFFWYYFFLFLFLASKENLPPIAAFIGISLTFFSEKDVKKHGVITFLISCIYFMLALKVIIPFFNYGNYDHWSYSSLGSTPVEALKNILLNPFHALKLLFDDSEKLKFWILFLVSGGILVFFKPKYVLLLVPLFMMKFFSDNKAYWGPLYQYSIEFTPVVALGAATALARIKKIPVRRLLLLLFVAGNIFILVRIHLYDGSTVLRIFNPDYYSNTSQKTLEKVLRMIPPEAPVSAQNTLVPHLAERNEIYLLPKGGDKSSFILLNLNEANIWPFENHAELENYRSKLDQDSAFRKIFEEDGVVLYNRL